MHNIFQPILRVDQGMKATIDGYEMLIRNEKDAFPGIKFLDELTTESGNLAWIELSELSLTKVLSGHPDRKIYINIEPCQLKFSVIWDFLAQLYQKYSSQVALEITERRELSRPFEYLDQEIKRLNEIGFELAIDDGCAGSNSYTFIMHQLGSISRIKLSLLVFKNEDIVTARQFIKAWFMFAKQHQLDFVVEGIADQQMAKYFSKETPVLQQGFYWGRGSQQILD